MGSAYTKPREVESVLYEPYLARFPDQRGKVIAITGTTSGTGYILAKVALLKGAHVVLLNRKSERAAKAEKQLGEEAPEALKEGRITAVDCDLQDFASVRAAAQQVRAKFGDVGLDAMVNNAGVMALADKATGDGYDVQMQTNHLSHFLLNKELFPLLQVAADKRGEARVVNHSSIARKGKPLEAQYFGKNGGNLGGDGASMFFGGARWTRYHHTKLANIVYTLALHDKLAKKGLTDRIKSVCAAPGMASTNLQVTTASDGGFGDAWLMKFSQSAEDGAMPLAVCTLGLNAGANAAKEPAISVGSGEFYEPAKMMGFYGTPVKTALTAECTEPLGRAMLWEESEKACGEFVL